MLYTVLSIVLSGYYVDGQQQCRAHVQTQMQMRTKALVYTLLEAARRVRDCGRRSWAGR